MEKRHSHPDQFRYSVPRSALGKSSLLSLRDGVLTLPASARFPIWLWAVISVALMGTDGLTVFDLDRYSSANYVNSLLARNNGTIAPSILFVVLFRLVRVTSAASPGALQFLWVRVFMEIWNLSKDYCVPAPESSKEARHLSTKVWFFDLCHCYPYSLTVPISTDMYLVWAAPPELQELCGSGMTQTCTRS